VEQSSMHQFFAAGKLCKIILSMVGWRVISNIIIYRIMYAYNLGQSLVCQKISIKYSTLMY